MPRSETPTPSLLIVVPRDRADLFESLKHSLGDSGSVQVLADRRRGERRARAAEHQPERRVGDRRRRTGGDAELAAGRWIAVPLAAGAADLSDTDARAIMFLCCTDHVVPCQTCQDTYRLGWIRPARPGLYVCPRCESDLTSTVVAHTATCPYWTRRETKRMAGRRGPREESPDAAAG